MFLSIIAYYNVLFFFSSRRRHTRLQGDWSSDVCSSDLTLEVITVPVSDVDRAKEFYVEKLGFHEDGDWKMEDKRYVQLTPVGSGCSICKIGRASCRERV